MNHEPTLKKSFFRRAGERVKSLLKPHVETAVAEPFPPKSFTDVQREEWWEIRKARELRAGRTATDPPADDGTTPGTGRKLAGLAFSGGGIRSATLNLGVLQGLASFGFLRKIDYLSAVSGGNYIASWLAAWIKREGFDEVLAKLSPDRATPAGAGAAKPARAEEAAPIRWLRDYSNYLTPRLGLFSGDTWSAVATYLRNLLLNQTILFLVFCGLLLMPRVLTLAGREIGDSWYTSLWRIPWDGLLLNWLPPFLRQWIGEGIGPGHFYFLGAFVLLMTGVWQIHSNMSWFSAPDENAASAGEVLGSILIPFIVASWVLTVWLWYGPASDRQPGLNPSQGTALNWMGLIAFLYTMPWLTAFGKTYNPVILGLKIVTSRYRKSVIALTAPIAGALGGILLWGIANLFHGWQPASRSDASGGLWQAMSWGTPLVLTSLTLMAVLHIGMMGLWFQEPKREWWSRLGGMILSAGLAWAALFGFAVYGPLVVMWMGGRLAAGGLIGWIATTMGGVLGGRSAKSGAQKASVPLEMFLKVAPPIFIAGLLLLVSFGLHLAVVKAECPGSSLEVFWQRLEMASTKRAASADEMICVQCANGGEIGRPETGSLCVECRFPEKDTPPPATTACIKCRLAERDFRFERPTSGTRVTTASLHWRLMNWTTDWRVLIGMLVAFLLAYGLAWRVDINEFSMHYFYRNRLARCYLGASREKRKFNPFTGFAAKDDLYLASLSNAQSIRQQLHGKDDGRPEYAGPYPLVNSALNVTTGEKLAWQSRKARSFTFSPRSCGFELLPEEKRVAVEDPEKAKRLVPEGYRDSVAYAFSHYYGLGGPLSGTAMGISGAAASPNMGYHSSAPLAFLMTVFNVRLGMWLGNPRHRKAWDRSGPRWGLPYLFSELAGQANDERWYVYLSDGGHFENLGVYELVRRRCKTIVACDAGADPEMTFEDLGNAIQKCRIDFGVDIQMDQTDFSLLKSDAATRFSRQHYAKGRIRYDLAYDGESEGVLIYLKASLTDDMPADLLHYMKANRAFPHTSTGDQFFDEKQFESYRELGYAIVESAKQVLDALL